jgi:uncharacterized protein (DUF362 family)
MNKSVVSIVRYQEPLESVRKVVELAGGLGRIPAHARVFIKPNVVTWTRTGAFPKWGVLTTSRVVEDTVVLLKEHGVDDITIGEGPVLSRPGDRKTTAAAFEGLGYGTLKSRYGVKCIDVFQRPFEAVDLGDGVTLKFNTDILHSDFVVNLPVLKTHAAIMVSLGLKNLKGVIDVNSRKKCHNSDSERDLHFMVAKLAGSMPPTFTLLDGIYTNERGPGPDGKARRSDILVASWDMVSADMVGAKVLGHDPVDVPHLAQAARERGRPADLSDVDVVGERIEDVASYHEYTFPFNEDDSLPLPLVKMGIKGLAYRKYDLTLCTYCFGINSPALTAIGKAWRGEPWNEVEVLTGKSMQPTPGKRKTILIGKCMYQANKDHPDIEEMIAVKGCPPSPKAVAEAFQRAGIEVDPAVFENLEEFPGTYLKRYEGRPEFEESFFRVA